MTDKNSVSSHYTHGNLVDAIHDGIRKLDKTIDEVHIDDLSPIDEFHIGGRLATENFLSQLNIESLHHVLDVGCGLGGGSRYAAQRYDCRVTGIDLTQEYVEVGNMLCEWVGLEARVRLQVADATHLTLPDDSFDRAFMMHVGMNIDDKQTLAHELHRVVRPGGKVGIYDVMQVGEGDLQFPVPWAENPQGSAVSSPALYRTTLQSAGFEIVDERIQREFALEFFAQLKAKIASAGDPPALGLHILMGETAPVKLQNMIENVSRNIVAPVEMIAVKAQ